MVRKMNSLAKRLAANSKMRQPEPESASDGSEFDLDNAIEEKETQKPLEAMEVDGESDGDEEERELQAAFAPGLLKDGLNVQVAKKRPIIDKSAEMKEKLAELTKDLPWVGTLEVVTPHVEMDKKAENDDFQRELNFQLSQCPTLPRIPLVSSTVSLSTPSSRAPPHFATKQFVTFSFFVTETVRHQDSSSTWPFSVEFADFPVLKTLFHVSNCPDGELSGGEVSRSQFSYVFDANGPSGVHQLSKSMTRNNQKSVLMRRPKLVEDLYRGDLDASRVRVEIVEVSR